MYPWQSPPHKEKSNVGRISFEILFEFVSTLPVLQLALFRKKLSPSTCQDSGHPRENVDAELSASTADAVLEFSVLTLLHLLTLFCNTFLPYWMLQSDSVFSSSSCFPAKINHCCDLDLKA